MRLLPRRRRIVLGSLLFFVATARFDFHAAEHPFITMASTTSTEQSGLFAFLLPTFTQRTGIDVYVAAVGTGAALKAGELGECDVVLVHDRSRELQFMQNGFGNVRREVMYNDFVIVGPKEDPAKINASHDAVEALRKIADARALFISRGDMSGTDAFEQRLWTEAGHRPIARRAPWYVQTGSSMEQTLATAASMNAYTLTDRATWLKFNNSRNLKIVVAGAPRLRNQYAVILVNPMRHPKVKTDLAMAFVEWLTSREGQDRIASYKIEGEQVFFPNYKP